MKRTISIPKMIYSQYVVYINDIKSRFSHVRILHAGNQGGKYYAELEIGL